MPEPSQIPSDDLVALPLFPLSVVLFPGMALPLHIFEERYKALIADCIEREEPFGVVLINEGQEVGEPAEPFHIGTTARILRVERLAEGRMNILTRGEQRFETAKITQHVPHIVGQVHYLKEEEGEIPSDIVAEIKDGYATFLRNLSSLTGGWTAQAEIPQNPVSLSYGVASGVVSTLDLPRHQRQELLELPTAGERLERLLPLLKRGNEAVQKEVAKRNPFKGPRLN